MSIRDIPCRLCFQEGEQPQCRTFETSIGAMRVFGALFNDGKMPVMCQGNDRQYRVCFQIAVRPAAPAHRIGDYSSVAA